MEDFCSINFPDTKKVDNTLERLILLLKYFESKLPPNDAQLSKELQIMQRFIETQFSLVDRQKYRYEAADWLSNNKDIIINKTTKHILSIQINICLVI